MSVWSRLLWVAAGSCALLQAQTHLPDAVEAPHEGNANTNTVKQQTLGPEDIKALLPQNNVMPSHEEFCKSLKKDPGALEMWNLALAVQETQKRKTLGELTELEIQLKAKERRSSVEGTLAISAAAVAALAWGSARFSSSKIADLLSSGTVKFGTVVLASAAGGLWSLNQYDLKDLLEAIKKSRNEYQDALNNLTKFRDFMKTCKH